MHRITKIIDFCYGHRLLNYQGPCRHLHGHNGRVEIDLAADQLDAKGMVVDFHEVKRLVKSWIDTALDHRMILHRDDPMLPVFQERGEPVFVMDTNPTAENIAKTIFEFAHRAGLPVIEVRLWETPSSFAAYRKERI